MPKASDPSFVHVFSDAVWFVQWTDRNGTLTGQLQTIFVQSDLTMHSDNKVLSGVRSGADVTLTVGGMFSGTAYTGTLRGSTLVLNIPLQNGSMETVVFRSGTVEDYNRAVAALRARVDNAIQMRQQAADLAARQHTVVVANERLRDAMYAISTRINQLKRDTNFRPVLDKFSKDWEQMQRDYATLQADAAKRPLTCGQLQGPVMYDLQGRLTYDLQGRLGYDNTGAFAYRQQTVRNDASLLTAAIQDTRQAFGVLQQAVQQNILGTPGPAFTDEQVEAMTAAGYKQIHDSNEAVSAAESQKDHILSDAQALFNNAKDFVAHLTCEQ